MSKTRQLLNKQNLGITPGLPLEASKGGIEELRRDIQRLMDMEAIRQLKYAYFRCVDTCNLEELATLFHDDVSVHFVGGGYEWKLQGKQDYVNNIGAAFSREAVGQHNAHHPEIQMLSETEATAIWYLEDNMWILNHNARTRGTALYWDRYLKVNGKWLIKDTNYERIYEINDKLAARLNLSAHYLGLTEVSPGSDAVKMKSRIAIGVLVALALAIVSFALLISHTSPCEPSPALAGGAGRMQAIVYRCYGPPEVLQYEEIEPPVPAEDEVLVRVRSASVNPLDWHYLRGSPYVMRLGSGLGVPKVQSLGTDFAGTVEAVGRKVTGFKPGDEVFGGGDGSFAQQMVVRESGALAAKPANVSFEQAAAIPIAGITALQALRDKGGIKPGMKVLVNGASGGVGTFAVQLAKHFGAEVTGVSSTRNIELVRSLGADHVIDYTREDYTAGGRQYDLILDNVGNHSPWQNSKVMTADGTLVMIGGPGGNWLGPLGNPLAALILSPFVDQDFVLFMARLNQQDLALLAELAQSGEVTPVIDRRFSLVEVPAAINYSEQGRARGKIVIDVEQPL